MSSAPLLPSTLLPPSVNIDSLTPTELLRRLQKGQKLRNELISELDLNKRRMQRMKNERNVLLDAVWEQEIKNDLSLPTSSSTEEDVSDGGIDSGSDSGSGDAYIKKQKHYPTWNSLQQSSEYNALEQMVKAMEDESFSSDGRPIVKKSKKESMKEIIPQNTTNTPTPSLPQDAPFHVVVPLQLKLVSYGVLQSNPLKIANYQTKKFVFPLGFHTSCIIDNVLYNSKISDGGMYPLFTVYSDVGHPFVGATPTAAWSKALNRKVNGYELYGLLSPSIREISLTMPTIGLFEEFIKENGKK